MPLVTRHIVTRSDAAATLTAESRETREQLLLAVEQAQLSDVIHSIGQLSKYAAELFEALIDETTVCCVRVAGLAQRTEKVEEKLDEVVREARTSLTTFQWKAKRTSWRVFVPDSDVQLIRKGTCGLPLARVYESCTPLPALSNCDQFRDDKRRCIDLYSYPQFFVDEYTRLQEEKNKEREAALGLKKKRKKRKIRVKRASEVISIRRYDADGNLITDPTLEAAAVRRIRRIRKFVGPNGERLEPPPGIAPSGPHDIAPPGPPPGAPPGAPPGPPPGAPPGSPSDANAEGGAEGGEGAPADAAAAPVPAEAEEAAVPVILVVDPRRQQMEERANMADEHDDGDVAPQAKEGDVQATLKRREAMEGYEGGASESEEEPWSD